MLEVGAQPNIKDKNGRTALHRAALEGHAVCVKALLEGGADPSLVEQRGDTVLHHAAQAGNIGCVLNLIEGGAVTLPFKVKVATPRCTGRLKRAIQRVWRH